MRAGDFRCTCHSLSPGQVVVNRGRQTWRERIDYEVAFSGGSMGGGAIAPLDARYVRGPPSTFDSLIALLHVHRDIPVSVETVIQKFATKKKRCLDFVI